MKTIKVDFPCRSSRKVPEIIRTFLPAAFIFVLVIMLNSCRTYVPNPPEGTNIAPPSWAPYYDNIGMVRYYYFPDIECYYDVWNREFIYLDDANWMFGSMLPPSYGWYDLNTGFIVLLDYHVYEPWRHFNYYVSHYPPYYYRSIYRERYEDATRPMRGFNENSREPVDRSRLETEERGRRGTEENERTRVEPRRNDQGTEVKEREQSRREERMNREIPERRVEPTRPPQRVEYSGKEIGRPVKVQQNMARPKESRRK